jgi:hypothetical protein
LAHPLTKQECPLLQLVSAASSQAGTSKSITNARLAWLFCKEVTWHSSNTTYGSELSSFGISSFRSKKFRMAAPILCMMTPSAACPSIGS